MKYNITIPQNFKKTSLNQLLCEEWLVPRKQRHFLRTKKNIKVNDKYVDWSTVINAGDLISITFEASDFPKIENLASGNPNLVDVLYEDNHIIIVNKPEGMKTHPNHPDEITLLNHVSSYLKQPAFVVHRLDTATSGAILFAKNQFILPILGQMLESKKIQRTYIALCKNHFSKNKLTINQPLGRNRHNRKKYLVTSTGKKAITHVQVLKTIKNNSLIECQLDTGRTHQIRVHLSHLNHPIIGDELYGQEDNRLMLHARKLELIHPLTNEFISVEASSKSFDHNLKKRG